MGLLDGFAVAAGGEVDFAAVALVCVVAEPVLEEGGTGRGLSAPVSPFIVTFIVTYGGKVRRRSKSE